MMQEGTDRWQAAGWLGMTLEQLENGYRHITRTSKAKLLRHSVDGGNAF
jgi:hypothetical protein